MKFHASFLLIVSLVALVTANAPIVKLAHASGYNGTGLVCITTSTASANCPTAAPVIAPLAVGSNLTIGVFINNSLPMGGYDIYVATNNAILHPIKAALGTLIASPALTGICINGSPQTGSCTVGTANGVGVVEVTTIDGTGNSECAGIPPCSGLAFTITYTVESLAGTQFSYPSAAGCSGSSVGPSSQVCVLVADNLGTTLAENVQAATYGVGVDFSFSPALPQIGQPVIFTPTVPVGTPPFTYSWTFGDGGASNVTAPIHVYSTSGTFSVNVTLTDSSTPPRTARGIHLITVQPPNFTISVAPSTVGPLAPNVFGQSNITITGISLFTGTVTLSLAPSPNLRVSLGQNNISLNSTNRASIVTASVGASTPGSYSVLIKGSSEGFPTQSVNLSVNVGDFKLSGPAIINILPSASNATAQVRVSPLFGFNGNVSLSLSSLPGLVAAISPSTVSGSGVATLIVSGSPGTYTLVVTGSSPGFSSHSILVQINIGIDFALTSSAIRGPIHPNEFVTTTVTVTSVNGFSGVILLALIPSSGLIVSISSVTVFVSPGSPGTATLSLGSPGVGTFPITIVGSSDGLPIHSTPLSLVVTSDPPPTFTRVGLPSGQGLSISAIITGLTNEWLILSVIVVAVVIIVGVTAIKRPRPRP